METNGVLLPVKLKSKRNFVINPRFWGTFCKVALLTRGPPVKIFTARLSAHCELLQILLLAAKDSSSELRNKNYLRITIVFGMVIGSLL